MINRKAAMLLGAAIAALGWVRNSVAATMAGWTFETSPPGGAGGSVTSATFGPQLADVGTGSAFGVHAGATTVWSNPAGNGSLESFSANVWALNDYYEFQTTTTGYEDVIVSFAQTRSSTGPHFFEIEYSNDGSNFTSAGTYTLGGTTWSTVSAATAAGNSFSFDLSAETALDNQASVYFRVRNDSTLNVTGGTIPTSGTSRIDDVFVTANPIPEPASLGLMSAAAALALTRRRTPKQ